MSDTPRERIRKMMQDADDNNVPAHHRPGLVMSLLRQFGDELAAMTARAELAERERDYAIDCLAEGYRQAHEAIIEAAKGVQG